MPKQSRNSTKHSGVFFVEFASVDQTFFIRYKKDRKLIEERAGRKSQGWTAAKANRLRTERLAGKSESNVEKRAREKVRKESVENRWTFQKIFDEYQYSSSEDTDTSTSSAVTVSKSTTIGMVKTIGTILTMDHNC